MSNVTAKTYVGASATSRRGHVAIVYLKLKARARRVAGRAPCRRAGKATSFQSMGYQLLDPNADCCRQNHLHQRSYGVHLEERSPLSRRNCGRACSNESRCMFFSWSRRWKACVLCATCELSSSVVATSRAISSQFESWSRLELKEFRPLPVTPRRPLLDDDALQHDYSVKLYGSADRVPTRSLRLVWLSLLPASALDALHRTAICQWNSMLPFQERVVTVHSR